MKTIIKLLLIYLGLQLVGGLLALPIIIFVNQVYGVATALLLSSLLMCWYLLKKEYIKMDSFTWSIRSFGVLAWVIVLGLSTYYVALRFNDRLDLPNLMEDQFTELSSNLLGIAGIVLIGPIAEELLFRGAILGSLLRMDKSKSKNAIVVSALIFGIIHFNPAQIVYAFILGLVLARIYYQTGSLLLCIILHVMLNGFSTLLTNYYPEAENLTELSKSMSLMWLLPVGLIIMAVSLFNLKKMLQPPVWQESVEVDANEISNEESKK